MNAEIIELDNGGMPSESTKVDLVAVPRVGELLVFGERYFEVANVIHRFDAASGQCVGVFVRPTKEPYREPKSRFGFGSR